jgi:transposase
VCAQVAAVRRAIPAVLGRPCLTPNWPFCAALLLVAVGDHPERLRSEAAWAHLCAVAPIPAFSGKITRHRLNPGGDRQANHALWRIVITRMSTHPPTRIYVARRTKEGLSKKEIIRCLKRYVAREIYPHLRAAAATFRVS